MAINWVTGKVREGKTLWTICWVKQLSEKDNRPVYYYNEQSKEQPFTAISPCLDSGLRRNDERRGNTKK